MKIFSNSKQVINFNRIYNNHRYIIKIDNKIGINSKDYPEKIVQDILKTFPELLKVEKEDNNETKKASKIKLEEKKELTDLKMIDDFKKIKTEEQKDILENFKKIKTEEQKDILENSKKIKTE